MKSKYKERLMQAVFFIAACASILAVVLICVFLFANGLPAMGKIGVFKFLLGTKWKPGNDIYGIFPMILGSIYVTAGAIVIGAPVGILTSVFMAEYCPKKIYRPLKMATELLAGIPSIVYGFFGLVVLVPIIRTLFQGKTNGSSILTSSILLGMMILPTIIGVTESSIRTVPRAYFEGALALGAVVLGIGRAIGETMAVMMVAGNQARVPNSILQGVRTLTTNIVLEMGYATGLHREALIATAVVLFIFILIINFTIACLNNRKGDA